MSRHSRIHGSITLSHTPTSEQLKSIYAALAQNELENMLTFAKEHEDPETFICDWHGEIDTGSAGNHVFAKRLARVIESPDLDAFSPAGEFIILSDDKPLPSLQRLSVKAGIVTHTDGRHIWEPVSTIIKPEA